MGRIKRKNTLSRIFMRYVLAMLTALVALVVGIYLILYILICTGCIYPANYAEKEINEAYSRIRNADKVTQDMIPPLCRYVVFSANGEKLGGNMSEQSVKIAWKVANHENATGKYFYKMISRPEESVVLQYSLTPQYRSAFLREHFIGPQSMMGIMVILGAISIILLLSIRFGKKIRRKMQPVLKAIEQIKNQNLEYETSYSGIKEFDDCISSIDDMREALKDALEQQWKTEQDKNRQMSALAHDIKTPLTVVRGNAELLSETPLTKEQKNHMDYIINSTAQIQNYVQKLIDVSKSADPVFNIPQKVMTGELIGDIRKQAKGLAELFDLEMNWKERWHTKTVNVVYDQVVRAVMNIIQNAAEHTGKGGTININVEEKNEKLTFLIEDSGQGFTKEALLHGSEQFFMDDTSRSGDMHYGIGLFFAKTVAEKYGGELLLANSKETGGAKVEIGFDLDRLRR